MKSIFILLISLTIFTCKNSNPISTEDENHMELHEEMDKVDAEYIKFEKQLINLYTNSEKNPENTILKIDSLLIVNQNETDKYKSQIKSNIESSLHYFKAELFYKIGDYNKSIVELKSGDHDYGDDEVAYAANYIKLKDFKNAKISIDSIPKSSRNTDYATANYYECIGNKTEALKIYTAIKNDKSIKHYFYYKLAVNRFIELQKSNPKLLNEIYFPTNNPSFEICDSDNENRTKIMELMQNLPENQDWAGTAILESPQENDKNYYWVRVNTKQGKEFNYYIYQQTFQIKFFNPKNKKLMTLEEWRKSR